MGYKGRAQEYMEKNGKRKHRNDRPQDEIEERPLQKKRLTRKEQRAEIQEKKSRTKLHYDVKKEAQKRLNTFHQSLSKLKKNETDKEKIKEKQHEMIQKIYDGCVKGKTLDLSRNSSGARILQALIKNGSNSLKKQLFDEFETTLDPVTDAKAGTTHKKGTINLSNTYSWMDIASNQFGKFVMIAFFKAGGALREEIIKFTQKHAMELLQHVYSLDLIEHVWQNVSSQTLRMSLLQDFYGAEGKVNKLLGSKKSEEMRERETYKYDLTHYAVIHPETKPFMIKQLLYIVKKAIAKGLVITHNIMHYLLMHVIQLASPDEVKFILEDIMERIPSLTHTTEGSLIGSLFVYYTRAKERKALIKAYREYMLPASMDKHTWRVLASLLDSTDDTMLTAKHVLKPLLNADVFASSYGRLLWLYIFDRNHPLFKNYPILRREHSADDMQDDMPFYTIRTDIHEKDEDETLRRISKKEVQLIHLELITHLVIKLKLFDYLQESLESLLSLQDEQLQFTLYRMLHDDRYSTIFEKNPKKAEALKSQLDQLQQQFVALTHKK